MKKFLLFLTLLVSAIGLTHAEDKTDVVTASNLTFESGTVSYRNFSYTSTTSGAEYAGNALATNKTNIQTTNKTNIQINATSSGFYVKNSPGTLKSITVETTNSSTTKKSLIVYANTSVYSSISTDGTKVGSITGGGTLTIDDTTVDGGLSSKNYVAFSIQGPGNAYYISKITVVWEVTTSGGEVSKDCGIAFDSASGSVDYPGTGYELPFKNPNKVDVTFTSTEADVATVANEDNLPKLTIVGCGKTTITAKHTSDGTYDTKEVSFTLNVTDPNNTTIALVFGDVENSLVTNNTEIGKIQYNGITFAFIKGGHRRLAPAYDNSDKTARIYKQNEFTITLPTGYTFEKIEFTSSDTSIKNLLVGSESDGSLTITESTKSALWTPAATFVSNSVTFKGNTSATTRIASITVYMKAPLADDDAGLAFANATDNATCGTTYTVQALTNPKSVDVDWSSSVTDVADFVDGVLEIKKAGTTTITATATDSKYTTNNTASYTLTIAKGKPGLAFAAATVNKIVGDAAFTNPLTNPHSLPITYSIDPADSPVATVDANTGEVTVRAAGEVKIVASSAETENYKAGSASYTLKVVDTKLYDTFNASNLTFDEGTGYRSFTYNGTSGAVYGGFADANGNTLMIQNQANGKSGIFVSQAPEGYKLHTITVTTATGSADLTLYGNTKPYASVSTDGKEIGTFVGGNKDSFNLAGYQSTLDVYDIIPTTFSICGADNASSVTEITVIWELDTRAEAELAYASTEVTLAEGETLTQPKLNNPNSLPVTYSSDNDAVATVAEDGKITLAGGIGTAVITASTEGNDTHKAGSATFTITVAKQYVFADTKATLVTDANTLKAGDIIAIGHWSKTQSLAMTNSTSEKYFVGDNASYNADHSELTLTNTVLLMQLEEVTIGETTQWGLKTLNFDGEQGYVGGSAKAVLNVSKSADDVHTATITITDSKAKILFRDSWVLRCNTGTNPARFAAYAGSVEPVYIYKVETPTTIVAEDRTEVTINEGQGPNTLSAMSSFSTNSTVDNFVVKMNGVTITSADVVRKKDTKGNNNITVNLSGLPYIPGAEFTIAPVVNGVEGHSEVLGIQMPELPTFNLVDSKAALTYDGKEAEAGPCNIDAWVKLYITSTVGENAKAFNYYFEIENKSGFENAAWDWLNDDKGYGITYIVKDYLSNVTTQKQGEGENAIWTPVLPTEASSYTTLKFDVKPYFAFYVTPELASLITEANPAPMAAPARAGEGFVLQNVYSTQVFEQQFNFSASSEVSGVEGVTVDANAPVEFFNLQGVRVDGDLTPGIYIRRQGQSVSKVQIR